MHLAVGSCLSTNNNAQVLLRIHVLDYLTAEPVENATVSWYVTDLNGSSDTYLQDFHQPNLVAYTGGWYGGVYTCECSDEYGNAGCEQSNESIFKKNNLSVTVVISIEGCGSASYTIVDGA